MLRCFASIAMILMTTLVLPAAAADYGTRDEAVAMVKRVQAKFKADGPAATFNALSDQSAKDFHDRDLYAFVYDMKGLNLAHGSRPALIGKTLIDLKDQDGKYLIRSMIEVVKAKGSGWVDRKSVV